MTESIVDQSVDVALPGPAELLELLRVSVDEVFETMLDSVAVLIETQNSAGRSADEAAEPGGQSVEAVVEFRGPLDGAVVIRCSDKSAADLAREMLMVPATEVLKIEQVKDALGECANMVSGSLAGRAGNGEGLRLGLPQTEVYQQADDWFRCGRLVYCLSQGRVGVEIWLDSVQ